MHKYTGSLRAVYPEKPVPKREVPPHIVRPDHANDQNGVSFSERKALINERSGRVLNAEEIEGMRVVCRVRPLSLFPPLSLLAPPLVAYASHPLAVLARGPRHCGGSHPTGHHDARDRRDRAR